MKNVFLVSGILLVYLFAYPQKNTIDSLNNLINHTTEDTGKNGKTYLLTKLAIEYQTFSLDTALIISQRAYKLAVKTNDRDGISRASNIIGTVYLEAGNYAKALEYYIKKLKMEEEGNSPEMLSIALMNIAAVYHKEESYEKAFHYAFRADSIINRNNINSLKLYSLLNLGEMFEKAGNNNSAILYTQKAFDLAVKENNIMIEGAALNNLGNIYAKSGYSDLAIKNYKNAIPFLIASENNTFLAESSLGLAIQYELKSEKDSALYYGNLSYDISRNNKFIDKQLDAGIFLADFYKKNSDIEKAFAFQEEAIVLKDSIYSKDRITKIQFLSAEEELRQKEIAEMKLEEELDRKIKLQYLFICIFIPVLFFFTLYLSNRKIRPKMIEFLGIVSLLLTFEFIMVLLHPFIADFTHHLPLYQLLIFAVIASVLTPIHHRIEKLVLKILSGKDRVYLLKFRIQ